MIYQTLSGEKYDISQLTGEEQKHFAVLRNEHNSSKSWVSFQNVTIQSTVSLAKKVSGENWSDSLIYKMQLDMSSRVGIREGQMKGELSDMLLDDSPDTKYNQYRFDYYRAAL